MTTVVDELRRQIKEQLVSRRESGMRVSDIAAQLEVRRATVYQLLEGETTPTAQVLCNCCRNLRMSFHVNGHLIGAIDFPPKAKPPVTAVQLGLFEMTASTDEGGLTVTLKKSSLAIELGVRLAG